MVYDFVVVFVTINLIYEMIEFVFPISKIGGFVKSFSLVVLLYAMMNYIVGLF